jgi:hypothetical protein
MAEAAFWEVDHKEKGVSVRWRRWYYGDRTVASTTARGRQRRLLRRCRS